MSNMNYGWEPVASSTQVAIIPFIAAVEGYLAQASRAKALRVTLHRVINREDKEYLQQACNYFGSGHEGKEDASGRIFATDFKMIGAAFRSKSIWRTRSYSDNHKLNAEIAAVDDRPIDNLPISYLSIPFLSKRNRVVAIFFAECFTFNFFSDDKTIRDVVAMCEGFCRLIDSLEKSPLSGVRNFPFPIPTSPAPKSGIPAYQGVHENLLSTISPPRFKTVTSLNLDVGP
jgi:hypothetical protein